MISRAQRALRKFLCATITAYQITENVYAQTAPGFVGPPKPSQPTAQTWNNLFAGKADWPGLFQQNSQWTGIQTFTQPANFGSTGAFTGIINFYGLTSGVVSVTVPAVAGNPVWTLPNSAGQQGSALMSTGSTSSLSWTPYPVWDQIVSLQNVNFASIADTQITVPTPNPNYVVGAVWIVNTGATANISSGSFSLCSQAGGAGTCVFQNASFAATQTGQNKVGNSFPSAVSNATYTNITTWFFRVTVPVASAAGDVLFDYRILPVGLP